LAIAWSSADNTQDSHESSGHPAVGCGVPEVHVTHLIVSAIAAAT
jgi:hypothetical protein